MNKTAKENTGTGLEIAVIGMSGRFPGANSIDEFWNNLEQGVESLAFFSDQEIKESGISTGLLETPGYVKVKGALENIENFDAGFFEYTAKEAEIMDPQLRFLHENCWQALENAGYDPWSYQGFIGLYAGASNNHLWLSRHLARMIENSIGENELFEIGSLNSNSSFCTRVSYKLNLRGPSIFVQTACSTSLVAIHLACQGLLAGECNMALAGGVSISIPKKSGYFYQEGMLHSLKGHVRTFDARADGTVFGNGVGIVLLKLLEEAITGGDTLYAVVKGSAVNNDGFQKVGFTAPGTNGQATVIRRALQAAEVEPGSVSYIEAHGTGTTLGDPIEIEALTRAFNTNITGSCKIGSVKSNIGHLDAAAGVAGFIKIVLALKHKMIPATLNFGTPNPEIDFENSPFLVNTTLTQWKNDKYPLRAGVSSFGIGGTNAHVVLEEAPPMPISEPSKRYQLILLSARTESVLDKMTENLKEYLRNNPGTDIADTAYTLQVGRKAFEWRRMWIFPGTGSELGRIAEALTPGSSLSLTSFVSKKDEGRPVIFMFPGQGAQYVDMGVDLYRTEPSFRKEMDRCFEILTPLMGYDIKEILYPGEMHNRSYRSNKSYIPKINQTEVTQPLLFIFEYALAALLIKWGIKPYAMIGHSIGEYVAACLAGIFSLEDALTAVVLRGKLMQQVPGGAMISISLPEEEVMPLLNHETSLAAVNSPGSCVVSGTHKAMAALAKKLEEKSIIFRRLHTSHAFHSQMMEPILNEFADKLKEIRFNKPQIACISNLTAKMLTGDEAADPEYWAKHLRETVQFSRGVNQLLKKEKEFIFVEVGPGKTLGTFVKHHNKDQEVVNLIRHPKEEGPDDYYLLSKIGQLWLYGVFIHWKKFYDGEQRHRIPLPTYPFAGQPYWFDENLIPMGKIVKESGEPGTVDSIDKERAKPLHKRPGFSTAYTPPQNEIEQKLVNTWQKIFGVDRLGIDDGFFELGGDSLKASIAISRIHKEFHVEVPLEEFFREPTIAGLASFIRDNVGKGIFSSIKPVEQKEYYPLSSAQKRLYILQQMEVDGTSYNIPMVVVLEGEVNREKLEQALKKLIQRHESLRTSIRWVNQEPLQQIHNHIDVKIEYYGRQTAPAVSSIKDFVRPFDLSQVPLLRIRLIKKEEVKHIFMVDMHHIITDGMSMEILVKELTTVYAGKNLPQLKLQYKDYSEWQSSELQKKALQQQKEYWLKQFKGEIPVLHLPTDYKRPAIQSFEGNTLGFGLSLEQSLALNKLSLNTGTTLYMMMLAVYNILLFKLSGQEDIIVGVPIAARRHVELADIIGMFVNTLVMRNYPQGEKTFKDFLMELKEKTLAAFENQEYPFEDLVDQVWVNRDASRNPLFDVVLALPNLEIQTGEKSNAEIPELKIKPYEGESRTAKFDLNLTCEQVDKKLVFSIEYCTKLFKESTIQKFSAYFKRIVSGITHDVERKISRIEIISEEEKKRIVYDFNDSGTAYPWKKTIPGLFAEQTEKTPDNIAIVGSWQLAVGKEENVSITYRELNEKSNRLDCLLRTKGVGPDVIIAIMMEQSIEMFIGLLGILKAGGAFLPIDLDYPAERIKYILLDSNAKILLTGNSVGAEKSEIRISKSETIPNDQNVNDKNSTATCLVLNFEHLKFEFVSNFEFRASNLNSSNLAYIIYTSGSTGKPKGTLIQHQSLNNLCHWHNRHYSVTPDDRATKYAGFGFDASIWEIFPYLITGASIFIINEEIKADIYQLNRYFEKNNITIGFLPTQICELFMTLPNCSLRVLLTGGDKLKGFIKRDYQLVNNYGPTENTVVTTSFVVDREYSNIPIGKPINNTGLYVLDKYNQLQPVGVPGELCISGDGLARGYLNKPELTAEKFVELEVKVKVEVEEGEVPLEQIPNKHMSHMSYIYKTGDLVCWLPEGDIEFLGRIDHQVKIRGYRIELGEIEYYLLQHRSVKETIVTAHGDNKGDTYLCAYVVAGHRVQGQGRGNNRGEDDDKRDTVDMRDTIDMADLREFLSKTLPDYMIPAYFLRLDNIPLTPSGKVNRKALPVPGSGTQLAGVDPAKTRYTPPGNKREEKLADIWANILLLDKKNVDINTNFFELGGNSLKMIRLNAAVREEFDLEVSFRDFIRHSTVAQLARFIGLQRTSNRKIHYPEVSPDPHQLHSPFPLTEVQLAYLLGRSGQIEMGGVSTHAYLEFSTRLEISRLNKSLNRVIQRHPMMRTIVLPDGQQRILETVPAYQMAVEDLSLLDPGEQGNRIEIERKRMSHYIFKPDQWPLFEIKAFKLQDGASPLNHLCIGFDPLFADAFSVRIIYRELGQFYTNPDMEIPPLEFSFRDYMMAYQQLRESEIYKADKEYWLSKLEDFPAAPMLPLKCNPADIDKPRFKQHRKVFSGEARETLKEWAKNNSITPSALLCTAYARVLAYWSNQPRLALNLTVFNRYPFHKDIDKIVGDFTSLILLDIQLKTGASFREHAHRLQDTLMEGLEHRHYDGVEFIREIGKYHQLTNKAVMPVVFTSAFFENSHETDGTGIENNGGGIMDVEVQDGNEGISQTSQVFIDCVVSDVNDSLVISWFYVDDLFEADVIDAMFDQYIKTLTTIIQGKPDYSLQLNQKHRLLIEEFNRTAEDIGAFTTLTLLFNQQVTRTPDNTALEWGEEVLTYRELGRGAHQVACYLRQQGVGQGDLVGVLTPRSGGTIVNVLGILNVGAAYVPIDPEYPEDRRNYILNNSNCKFFLQTVPAAGYEIKIGEMNQPGDIAYVIYTSGSTGRPKGVVITHKEACNTIIDINRKFCIDENDRIMGISSMCFDLSVYDVFGALSTGARLVIIATQKDVDLLIETLERNRVTLWNSVPAIMELVVNNLGSSHMNHTLRTVLLSGDWIPIKLPEKIKYHFPGAEVISLGGATEGSIWSIYYPIKEVKDQWTSIPYGYPLVNQEFYLLNFDLALCPPGVAGGLYIGGAGVAEGYINDQDKTHQSFIYHPILGRIYKTGDYGIFRSQGFIEFLGRKDQQVKIRGYRVELGEIESCLLEYEHVNEAVVVQKEKNRNKYLCAYIVAGKAGVLNSTPPISMEKELRTYISRSLPDYMIPSRFVLLNRLPLNINGKVDRKALPEPEQDSIDMDTIAAPPENAIQQTLLEIWEDILEITNPGIDGNFFELGGDSLKLITLVSKIHKRCSIKVPLAEVFNSPTIRELAAYIQGAEEYTFTGVEAIEKREYYPLSSAQKRLYVLHQMIGHNIGYNIPMVVELEGKVDIQRLEDTFVQLIRRHESLRTCFLMIGNGPVQGIHLADHVTFKIEYYKVDPVNPGIDPIIYKFIRPFDLSQAPLFRVGLIKVKKHILMVDVHHIISDRASLNLLIKDFSDFYGEEKLPPLRIQYRDYAKWQTSEHQKETIKQQEEYWLKQFKGEFSILDLPTDYPRPPLQNFEGDSISLEINSQLTNKIRKLTAETGTTLYIVLMAAYNILLAKYAGQEDIIIGTPISGRSHIELEPVIGVFVNMLAIRNHAREDRTFKEFLEEVKENAVQAYENQDYPFDRLVRALGLERTLNSQPLVNIVFQVYMLDESSGMERTSLSDGNRSITVTPYNYKTNSTKFDLVFEAIEMKDKIKITQEYSTALFKPSTIEKFTQRYIGILEKVMENSHTRLKDIKVSHDWSAAKPDVIDMDFKF